MPLEKQVSIHYLGDWNANDGAPIEVRKAIV